MKKRLLLLSIFTALASLFAIFMGERGEAELLQPPAALDRPRTPADVVPAELRARTATAGLGLDFAASRKLATDVYLVRGSDRSYCSLTDDGVTCGSASDIFGHDHPALWALTTTRTAIGALVELRGAVRRDVGTVRVDGVSYPVTRDGGFSISLESRPSSVEFVGKDGDVLHKQEIRPLQ
jgi:hypothetical protein